MQPASLVQSAETAVYLTGVWLDRTLAVYVNGLSVNFTVWGGESEPSILASVNTAVQPSVAMRRARALRETAAASDAVSDGESDSGIQLHHWSTDSVLSDTGEGEQRGRQSQLAHRFHVTQSSSQCQPPTCYANITLQGHDNSVLSFTAPVLNNTGYLPLVITHRVVDDGSVPVNSTQAAAGNFTGPDWMYYTPVECDTGLIVGLYCTPCPTGGYCPGGGRVWPLPGYWSFGETSPPVQCALPQACPGALSAATVQSDGSRATAVCAAGYVGDYCTVCAADYYADGQRCLSCGLQSDEIVELVILLAIFVALFLSLAVAVAVASTNNLSTAVSAVLLVQHLSVVGKLAGQQVPSSLTWLTQMFSILSMVSSRIATHSTTQHRTLHQLILHSSR